MKGFCANFSAMVLCCAVGMGVYRTAAAQNTNWYVAPAAAGGHDANHGTNWHAPLATISNALAQVAVTPATVFVSNGHYLLAATITNASVVILRSWHNGVLSPYNTVLDGGGVCRGVVLSNADAVLDGFTITNCLAANMAGGGVLAYAGIVRNSFVGQNRARQGGGVFLQTALAVLEECSVWSNFISGTVLGGAGVHVVAGSVRRCRIFDNIGSNTYGGGLFLTDGAMASDCVISNNLLTGTASCWGGGVMIYGLGTGGGGRLVNCQVTDNRAFNIGGGVYAIYGSHTSNIIDRCIIRGNRVDDSASGSAGGVRLQPGTMRNSLVVGNTARECGGVYLGGAVTNCLENCTVVSNTADYRYGGLYTTVSTNFVFNNIIYYNGDDGTAPNYASYFTNLTRNVWTANCTTPAIPGWHPNNITNPPVFFAFTTNLPQSQWDFHLMPSSHCVNAGSNLWWMFVPGALDLDGRMRVDYFNRKADMGCYEYLCGGAFYRVR